MLWRCRRWLVVFVGVALGCSAGPNDAGVAGSLSLDLTIADGIEIDEVQWEVSRGDMEPMSGTINTSAPGSTASVEVFGIPPGDDYLIQMEATATDGETTCKGSATFDVEVGEVTEVHVMLNCKTPPRFGGVRVNGKLNRCAELVKVVISPLQTSVGSAIDLFSDAVDGESDTITYMWSGAGGTIANPKAPTTTYTCGEPGEHQVRIVVSDDDFTHCMSDWTVDIACVATNTGCLTGADCNDGNECTADICQPDGSCSGLETPNTGASCASGDGTCDATGVCQPNNECSVDVDCPNTPALPADAQCTAAICDSSGFANACAIDPAPNVGVTCDFSAPGSADGLCDGVGECVAAEDPCGGQCASPTQCRVSQCNETTGLCEDENLPDGTDCSAELPPLASCESGVCSSNGCTSDVDCWDGNQCTFPLCDLGTGLCFRETIDGVICSLPGVAFATCVGGECTDTTCTSDDQCDPPTQCREGGVCNEFGACRLGVAVENGTPCERYDGASGVCFNTLCGCADDSVCSSGSECVAPSTCEFETGLCRRGPKINDGGPCNYRGLGPDAGRCRNYSCRPACSVAPCPDNGIECIGNLCDPTDGSCDLVNSPSGSPCDFDVQRAGACDGAGSCILTCTSDADCEDGNGCTSDACDLGTGLCTHVDAPNDGSLCLLPGCPPFGDEGTCASGTCVPNAGCATDSDCPNAPAAPASAQCTAAVCNHQVGCGSVCEIDLAANVGGACDFSAPGSAEGTCSYGGECIFTGVDCGVFSSTVFMGCTNSVTIAQTEFPNQLTIAISEPLVAGEPFTVNASGIGAFPRFFLNAAQSVVPGGVRSAIIEGFNATVEAASGASGSVLLQADPRGITPGLTRFCTYPTTTVCTADGDCIVPPCNPPVLVANAPISEDCSPGGVCDDFGQGPDDGPTAHCNITDPPEFCITGDLIIPLVGPSSVFTAGAAGDVTFNWAVDPATITCPDPDPRCVSSGGWIPDRSLALPVSVYGDPINDPDSVGLNGIRFNAGGALFVALQCSPAQAGGLCNAGVSAGLGCATDAECPGGVCVPTADVVVDSDPAALPRCSIP